MRNVTVTPSQSGPLHFDVFLNGWLYRSALSYAEALALAAELRKQDSAVKP